MKRYGYAGLIILVLLAVGFYLNPFQNNTDDLREGAVITLYKSEFCNCCENYIEYLENNGYKVEVIDIDDLKAEYERFGVPERMYSCHIAETDNYFLIGHIPVEAINKLLKEKPQIDGIALPGMPSGSPGMGGERSTPLVIYYLSGEDSDIYLRV